MIFVNGVQLPTHPVASSAQGSDTLVALMEDPVLVAASHAFKAIPERKFTVSNESGCVEETQSKYVYVFQREYATVNPALVDFVGTDEATTCVGLVIRNRKDGMTCVAHMDSPEIVDIGLTQMLSSLTEHSSDADLDVHLIGGYEDVSLEQSIPTHSRKCGSLNGYSLPLCAKIVETLRMREEKFHIQTLFILGQNTRRDAEGNAYPIFHGFLVETATGSVIPASFDRTSRCPDEIVRRIRVSVAYEDPNWNGKLLETYDTRTDQFKIAPCCWTQHQKSIAQALQRLSDSEILLTCSTSPLAEGPNFVENERRQWDYLIKHPNWEETFPMKQARVFTRTAAGTWKRCEFE